MWRSGGDDEPEVELLGEDLLVADAEQITTGRTRSWWPLWLGAALLIGIGVTAVASGSGGTGDGDSSEVAGEEVAGEETEPADRDPDDAAAETTTTLAPAKVTVLEVRPPAGVTEETDSSVGSPSTTVPPATAVAELGLSGHLWVWQARTLHSLDLSTGIWEELPPPPASVDIWDRDLALTRGGVLLVYGTGARLLSDEGEVLATRTGQYYAFSTVSDGQRAWLHEVTDFSTGEVVTIEVDAAGGFTELEVPPLLQNLLRLVPAGGSLFTDPVGAGIYEVLGSQTRRVSDGSLVAGGRDALLLIRCPDRIADCSLQRFAIATGTYREVEPPPDAGDLWGAWSPDLRYWVHAFTDTAIWDADEARWLGEGDAPTELSFQGPGSRPVWSADSRWVARRVNDDIRFRSTDTGAVVDIAAPASPQSDLGATLLFVP
jgi:hypothetical protein